MCSSRATIFYGVVVQIWTLERAARAHRTLGAPLLALDLVTRRRSQGTLRSSSPIIETVPIEVWGLIRAELIDVALEDAFESMLAELRCDECEATGAKRAAKHAAVGVRGRGGHLPIHDWNSWTSPTCGTCQDIATEHLFDEHERVNKKFSESLLKEFGLVLVSRFPACVDSRAQSEPDYTRSIPIGLAIESNVSSHQPINLTRKMETPYPTLSVSCSDVDDTQYATISAGLNHFTEHERRFRSLIHTYRLIISSESENTLGPFKASNSNEPETGATTAAAGPQWRLWLTEASCMM